MADENTTGDGGANMPRAMRPGRVALFFSGGVLCCYGLYLAAAHGIDAYGARRGAGLFETHCAACHGGDLAGQPGWQSPKDLAQWPAPPLNAAGHAWMHDDAALFQHAKYGAATSPMPAFADKLTDNELWQVFAYIKTHWPQSVRDFQQVGDPYAPLPADLPADWSYPPACEPGAAPGTVALQ